MVIAVLSGKSPPQKGSGRSQVAAGVAVAAPAVVVAAPDQGEQDPGRHTGVGSESILTSLSACD